MIAASPIVAAAAVAPPAAIEELTGDGAVLVLAPHPDDESLAMGAAIAAAVAAGHDVHVAIVTDGSRSHPASRSHPPERLAGLRRAEATEAVSILTGGRAAPVWLGFPDTGAPTDEAGFARAAEMLGPRLDDVTAIWTAWGGDPHCDHESTWRLALWLRARLEPCRLYGCPVWGRVETSWPVPPVLRRFPASRWRERKARAVAAHASQMTRLIADDPEGFTMAPELQSHFVATDEIFIPA